MTLKITLADDEYDRIVRRERNYLGYGPDVARMSDVVVLRAGLRRTRTVMRRALKTGEPAAANDALAQHHDTQLAFNRALDASL